MASWPTPTSLGLLCTTLFATVRLTHKVFEQHYLKLLSSAVVYLVDQLTPKGTTELDQRLGAALGDWGPYIGSVFGTKFG